VRRATSLCSVILALLLAYGLGAGFAAESDDTLELQDLMPKIFLAYGGKEALEKLDKSYTILGEQSAVGPEAHPSKFRQIRKGANLRIDVEPGGEEAPISTVYDGMAAWKATGKVVDELSPEQAALLRAERDHAPAVLTRFEQPGYTFKLQGRTTYRATPVYAIEITREDADPLTVYIDEKEHRVVGIAYKGTDPNTNSSANVAIDFSQYRPAAGTMVPFKQVQFVDDKPIMELTLSSIDASSEVDDTQFRRPDRPGEIRLSKATTVPFEYSHKEIVVKVRINGSEPMDFLFDTAASQTVIDRRVAAETFLDKQGALQIMAAGGAMPAQTTTIPRVEIGDLVVSDIQAIMLDMTPQMRQMGKRIAGIIGANVLSKFAVTIDFGRSQIVFNDAATYKPPTGATLVTFNNKQGPVVRALLNGTTPVSFLVDTGAAFNNLPTPVAKKFLGSQPPHMTEGTGLDGRPVKLATVNIPSVKIGAQSIRNVNFTYSVDQDVQVQQRGFVQGSNVGVLGNPFWQNFAMTMDYKFQRIALQPNTVVTARQEIDQLINTGDTKLIIHRDLRASEAAYQKALLKLQTVADQKLQAKIWGRIGNLRRVMAKDLNRPEQARIAYEYFSKAQELAHKLQDREGEGRILGDWSLLYLDNGQIPAAQQALQGATLYAPQDPQVNVNFAVYLYKMQMYPDMNKYVEKALFLDPSNWQALWYKVKLAEMFSDMPQLKDTLKEIVKYYPWSKLAQDKLASVMAPPQTVPPGAANPQSGVPNIVPSTSPQRPMSTVPNIVPSNTNTISPATTIRSPGNYPVVTPQKTFAPR
jgi:predicted aspartyl protease